MDAETNLNRQYQNQSIYTTGFYADPENLLDTRTKLYDSLKSFVMNQEEDTPFSLQIMTTNAEINVLPLGLINLAELKKYERKQREQHGRNYHSTAIPLVVQFAPHVKEAQVEKRVVTSTQELFHDFKATFPQIWAVVQHFLNQNQKILSAIEADLIADRQTVQKEYLANFQKMSPTEQEDTIGLPLTNEKRDQFASFMADMHEVQAIVLSAASFANKELLGDLLFAQIMNDNVRRSTLFWVLDNTFYEIYYYFVYCYTVKRPKLAKHLAHLRPKLIVNMRNDAFQRAQAQLKKPKEAMDFNHYFTDIFVPLAEQLAASVDQFKPEGAAK